MVTCTPSNAARGRARRTARRRGCGFTVIELLVVLAAMGLLLAIATPRYIRYIDNAREVALKQDLMQLREAIDKFYGDQSRYPVTLDELVTFHYLRSVPVDPITQRTDSWRPVAPAAAAQDAILDIHSGAAGTASDGSSYASW